MPYQNEHACRINDPDKYNKIRRKNGDQVSEGRRIDVIYGVLENGLTEIQALRYPTAAWSEEQARKHCADRKGSFEPAIDAEELHSGMGVQPTKS